MNNLRSVLEKLNQFSPKVISLSDNNTEISILYAQQITENIVFSFNVIYIGYASQLDMSSHISNTTLFIINDSDKIFSLLENTNNIILFPSNTNSVDLLQSVSSLLADYRRLLNETYNLFNIFLESSTMSEIINECAKLVNHPLLIIDMSFKLVVCSTSVTTNDSFWNQLTSRGYCTYEDIAKINYLIKVSHPIPSNKPYISDVEGSKLHRLVSKIFLDKRQVGFFISIGNYENDSFIDINHELFAMMSHLFSKVIAEEQKKSSEKLNSDNVITAENIIIECLEGKIDDKETYYDRLRLVDIMPNSVYQIFIMDINSYTKSDHKNFLKDHVSSFFYKSWSVCHNGNIVILADIKKIKNLDKLLKSNQSFFIKNNLRISYSDFFSDLFHISVCYRNAQQALYISKKLNDNAIIIKYEDYKFYDLIISLSKKKDLSAYMNTVFNEVIQYDKLNNTEYCSTIFNYIFFNKKLDDVAATLCVHKNTVSYRMRKAKDLFNIDFSNIPDQFKFYYSYILEEMRRVNLI